MSLYSNEIFTKLVRGFSSIHKVGTKIFSWKALLIEPIISTVTYRIEELLVEEIFIASRRFQNVKYNESNKDFDQTISKTFLIKHALWSVPMLVLRAVNSIVHEKSFKTV